MASPSADTSAKTNEGADLFTQGRKTSTGLTGRATMMRVGLAGMLILLTAKFGPGQDFAAPKAHEIVLREGLVIPPVGRSGRSAVHQDAIEAEIVVGQWKTPRSGDVVRLPDGSERKWEAVKATEDGTLKHAALGGGYAQFEVPSEASRVMVLEAAGHGMVYVNGEPRTGDPYSHGYVHLPVLLREGGNEFLFHVGRGSLQAKLVEPKAAAMLDLADPTLPDLIVGQATDSLAAVVVINASRDLQQLAIEATLSGGTPGRTMLPDLLPLSTRKIGFRRKKTSEGRSQKAAMRSQESPRKTRKPPQNPLTPTPLTTHQSRLTPHAPRSSLRCTVQASRPSVRRPASLPSRVFMSSRRRTDDRSVSTGKTGDDWMQWRSSISSSRNLALTHGGHT
jgi:hypothetical protein